MIFITAYTCRDWRRRYTFQGVYRREGKLEETFVKDGDGQRRGIAINYWKISRKVEIDLSNLRIYLGFDIRCIQRHKEMLERELRELMKNMRTQIP